ncbi:MAG: FAD:protein FMN transferase [Opitutae bacterium]|nr:FAD:protein FMN transferase [Opitutae bacterium]
MTVIAPTCVQAGVLSTTAFILPPEEGRRFIQESPGADGCILTAHARYQTRGFFNYVVPQ